MPYNPAIPQPTNLISNSQKDILGNFAALGTAFNYANGGFNQVSYNGVSAPGSPPSPSGISYIKADVTSTNSELWYRNNQKDIEITNSALTAASGEGMFPGGLQIRSAQVSLVANNTTFSFTRAFPTACIAVTLSNTNTGNNPSVLNASAFTKTGLTIFALNFVTPVNVSYIAIGY